MRTEERNLPIGKREGGGGSLLKYFFESFKIATKLRLIRDMHKQNVIADSVPFGTTRPSSSLPSRHVPVLNHPSLPHHSPLFSHNVHHFGHGLFELPLLACSLWKQGEYCSRDAWQTIRQAPNVGRQVVSQCCGAAMPQASDSSHNGLHRTILTCPYLVSAQLEHEHSRGDDEARV